MSDIIYTFNGKDITMNVCIQIKATIDVIKKEQRVSFEEAALMFYHSDTYKNLQNTENGLWAESPEFIADRFFDESTLRI